MKIAILMTCFNRANSTRRCLESIARQIDPTQITVYLVDDGSLDGTNVVAGAFGFVRYIRAEGGLFWNGGMHAAWSAALKVGYDAYLWLNDDVELDQDAIARATGTMQAYNVGKCRAIVVGATRSAVGNITYSGFRRAAWLFDFKLSRLPWSAEVQSCDTFNGNFVLVPHSVVTTIGINDPRYFHSFGDIDYGFRATKAGIRCLVVAGSVGLCEPNDQKERRGWGSRNLKLAERWALVNSHFGLPPRSWWRFCSRHGGPFWPLVFIRQYVYLLGLDKVRRIFVPPNHGQRR